MSGTPRPRRRERAAARRATYHAEQARRAVTPVQRLRAAAAYLTSEVAHSARPGQVAAQQVSEIAEHARHVMAEAPLSEASRRLHEAKLAERGRDVQRLATALMVLRSAVDRLPDGRRDELAGHYADELSREALQLARRHANRN